MVAEKIDASMVAAGLAVGSLPPVGWAVRAAGYHCLVLCAKEHQAAAKYYKSVEVIQAPLDDAQLTQTEYAIAHEAAVKVAVRMRLGKAVLVTCAMGINRSAFVAALALVELGATPKSAIERVRHGRQSAVEAIFHSDRFRVLNNGSFMRAIKASKKGTP